MGNDLMCVTTPKNMVTHGDANTSANHCVTTPPPYGGGAGGGDALSGRRDLVTQTLKERPNQ